ncbi:MAG: CRTAC1 family protein, partial [Verrucomicrobia bacterium]|nr:CRTAC1 family protein [Verrucomicrobiota bacterium]
AAGRFDAPGIRVWTPPRDLTRGMAFTCGDMDRDGDLDLFIGQYKSPYESGSMPTPCDNALDGLPAYLLRNEGDGGFRDATPGSGLEPKRHRRSYSASFADLDQDGALDLVVVSDFAGLDVHRGDGQGHFQEATARWFPQPQGLGMGHALSDFNADGLPDVLMIGMQSPTVDRLLHLGLRREKSDLERWRQATHGNRLWLGLAGGTGFEPWPLKENATRTGWSWGCTAADFDNDGWPDLAVANGMESRLTVRDYEPEFWLHDVFVGNSADHPAAHLYFQAKIARTQGRGQSYGGHEKNRLLLNQSGDSFLEAAHLLGVALEEDSRNLVGADLDADGRQDLVVTSFDAWPRPRQTLHVFRNTLPDTGPWIGFHLPPACADSCGATVTLSSRGKRSLRMQVTGDSHRSQHPATAHFGLGDLGAPEAVEIRWASGALTRIESPAPGRYHTVPPPASRSLKPRANSQSP